MCPHYSHDLSFKDLRVLFSTNDQQTIQINYARFFLKIVQHLTCCLLSSKSVDITSCLYEHILNKISPNDTFMF